MEETWLPESIWQSWSQMGRSLASLILHIPVEGVLPTTNHLESFNRLLKRKYIPLWQRSGSRLRFDFLISILITHILPEIFSQRQSHRQYLHWLSTRFTGITTTRSSGQRPSGAGLCWWPNDERRDADAHLLLGRGHLHDTAAHSDLSGYSATCTSSSRLGLCYQLQLNRDGHAKCDCPDFIHRGGACKHLRAFRLVVDQWIQNGLTEPFAYPATMTVAKRIRPAQPILPSTQPLPIPGSSHINSSASSMVDNLLALQNFARQSGALDEPFAGEDEGEDIIEDEASYHSDDSSCSISSAAELLGAPHSVSLCGQFNPLYLIYIASSSHIPATLSGFKCSNVSTTP